MLIVFFPHALFPLKLVHHFFFSCFYFCRISPLGRKQYIQSLPMFSMEYISTTLVDEWECSGKVSLTLFISSLSLRKLQPHWKTFKLAGPIEFLSWAHGDGMGRPSLVLTGILRVRSGMMRGGKIPVTFICKPELCFFFSPVWIGV